MPALQFREYEARPRAEFGQATCARLQALDERLAGTTGKTIFDWSRARVVRPTNYVGVIQDGDLQVEILPKTDTDEVQARQNLVYMLTVAGRLPVRERDLAGLAVDRQPVFEALIALFADRLLDELRRGLDREYVLRQENCGVVRGKLVLPVHLKVNAAHKERVFVEYSELLEDTWLNRILKRACRVLLGLTRSPRIQQRLKEALLMFADVSDVDIRRHHFARVRLTRNSARFEDVYRFARLVLEGSTPAPRAGATRTFSLLVPMDRLFEEFIGQLIRRHAPALGLLRAHVRLQARGHRRALLHREDGPTLYHLKPDILIGTPDRGVHRILDTKWKRLDRRQSRNPADADIYQLYAYANRYQAPLSILLYPSAPGLETTDFHLAGDTHHRRVRVAFINMDRDLRKECAGVLAELWEVIF